MSEQLSILNAKIGKLRHSYWLSINQDMINNFADVTLDHQFIHIDPVKATASPFGGTIAHGFLVLSLMSHLQESLADFNMMNVKMAVNYGFDRVRFISPVRSGSRVRLASILANVGEKKPLTFQLTHQVTVEIEGADKPALKAAWLSQLFF